MVEKFLIDGQYRSLSGLNYTYVMYFERKFFDEQYRDSKLHWMSENWQKSILYAFIYIAAVFGGRKLMETREKFDLRKALVAWNLVLAIFSAIGAIRVWPEFYHVITHHGVEYSVCNNSFTHGVTGGWAWLFILSKVPELVDTVFIVLRKQPLIFLHWYHHATVLVYCWFSCKDFTASGRWFMTMNYTVHAFMYSYYAFRAMRFNIPKFVNITITFGQILQMVFGIYVNLLAYRVKQRGDKCQVSYENINWSFIMYATYFILFFHFFYEAYIKKSLSSKRSDKKSLANGKHTNGDIVKNGHANGNHHKNGHTNGHSNGNHTKIE